MLFWVIAGVLVSCQKDGESGEPAVPTINNIEVGLNNNGIGVVGQDFHFEADIVAGKRIDLVKVRIEQRENEAYAGVWRYEVVWEQYRGARNVSIHKHFDIPADAVVGTYDFIIDVIDQKGAKLEEVRAISIYETENVRGG